MKNRFAALLGVLLTILGACHVRSEIARMNDGGAAGSNAGGSGGLDGLAGAGGAGGLGGMTGMENPPADLLDPWRDSVAYYIFVDRFANGDPSNDGIPVPGVMTAANWQGGDWQGIIDKIKTGYFSKLGVNSLWLGAPVDNPDVAGVGSDGNNYSAYHGYWPVRFDQTEEHFGSLDKLKELVSEAHNAGMTVVLDYPANHVHELSLVYSEHPDWFWPNSNGQGGNCVCGEGCSWEGINMERCWFTPYLPDFDHSNALARAYVIDNMIWWWKQVGFDGFRVGAIKHMHQSLLLDLRVRVTTDIEPSLGRHFFLVGSATTPDAIDPLTKLDGTEDIERRGNICTNLLLRKGTMVNLDALLGSANAPPKQGIAGNLIGSEYSPRAIHYAQSSPLWGSPFDDGKDAAWKNQPVMPAELDAFERLAIGYTLIMTIPGIPTIYYGDEIGLPGAGDPDNRRFMQWTGYDANQIMLRTHIEKLGQIRKDHIALRRGKRESLEATLDAMSYAMVHPAETVYVAINRDDASTFVGGLPSETLTDLLTGQNVVGPEILLPPRSSVILIKAN